MDALGATDRAQAAAAAGSAFTGFRDSHAAGTLHAQAHAPTFGPAHATASRCSASGSCNAHLDGPEHGAPLLL